MRVAIYARISADKEGAGLGVARQVADCRAYCERLGFEVAEIFEDNDTSAWSGKPRPGYDALLATIGSGAVDAAVVWHMDRLTRSARDLVAVVDVCERNGVPIHTVNGSTVDLTTSDGRLHARIVGAFAEAESDRKAERVRRKHRELAEAGKAASLGGSYGYRPDESLDPEQAAVIREMVDRLLAGDSLRSIAYDLNERAVPTARGGVWRQGTIRQIVMSGRIAGWREWTPRTPEDRRGWDGKPRRGHGDGELIAPGDWEAIISLEEHQALRALLTDPSRRVTRRRDYLLSTGLLRCGVCGRQMNHKIDHRKTKKNGVVRVRRYACIKQPGRGCGSLSIGAVDLENFVVEMLLTLLDGADLSGPVVSEGDVAKTRAAIQAQSELLIQVGLDHTDGVIGRPEWLAMRKRIEQRIEALEKELPDRTAGRVLRSLPTGEGAMRAAWPGLSLDQQRAVLAEVIDRIEIAPASKRGRPFFDTGRISVTWRV